MKGVSAPGPPAAACQHQRQVRAREQHKCGSAAAAAPLRRARGHAAAQHAQLLTRLQAERTVDDGAAAAPPAHNVHDLETLSS